MSGSAGDRTMSAAEAPTLEQLAADPLHGILTNPSSPWEVGFCSGRSHGRAELFAELRSVYLAGGAGATGLERLLRCLNLEDEPAGPDSQAAP